MVPEQRSVMFHKDPRTGRQAFSLAVGDPMCFPSRDVVRVAEALVANFNEEYKSWHHHADDEVRYFEDGSGTFQIRIGTTIQTLEAEKGTYIVVPAGVVHRFQSGPKGFMAHRLFTKKTGGGVPILDAP